MGNDSIEIDPLYTAILASIKAQVSGGCVRAFARLLRRSSSEGVCIKEFQWIFTSGRSLDYSKPPLRTWMILRGKCVQTKCDGMRHFPNSEFTVSPDRGEVLIGVNYGRRFGYGYVYRIIEYPKGIRLEQTGTWYVS